MFGAIHIRHSSRGHSPAATDFFFCLLPSAYRLLFLRVDFLDHAEEMSAVEGFAVGFEGRRPRCRRIARGRSFTRLVNLPKPGISMSVSVMTGVSPDQMTSSANGKRGVVFAVLNADVKQPLRAFQLLRHC